MSNKLHGLYDADQAIYMAGFGAAQVTYQILCGGTGNLLHEEQYMKDAKQYITDAGGITIDDVEIVKHVDPAPLSHSLHNLKVIIDGALQESGCDSYGMYLSKGKTFRDSITRNPEYLYNGKNKMYKGNRLDVEKPKYYGEMVDYMIKNYGARVCEGIEADDAVAIQQTRYLERGKMSVLISADKDLNTVPGLHYNPQKKVSYNVSVDEADEWFWCQMIMGDTADNITGLPRKGVMAAFKLLQDAYGHEERRKVVMDEYFKVYEYLEFYVVQEILQDTMNLLHMLRTYEKNDDGNIILRY